jgi:hypothetical protein
VNKLRKMTPFGDYFKNWKRHDKNVNERRMNYDTKIQQHCKIRIITP